MRYIVLRQYFRWEILPESAYFHWVPALQPSCLGIFDSLEVALTVRQQQLLEEGSDLTAGEAIFPYLYNDRLSTTIFTYKRAKPLDSFKVVSNQIRLLRWAILKFLATLRSIGGPRYRYLPPIDSTYARKDFDYAFYVGSWISPLLKKEHLALLEQIWKSRCIYVLAFDEETATTNFIR